jgi:predicted small secreted protein
MKSRNLLVAAVAILGLLQTSCAITASGMGIEVAWVIGDASIACDWDDGYPSGANCIAGGAMSEEAASVMGGDDE